MDDMVNTLCIVQARLTSTRLPNKVLMPLGKSGKTLLEHVYERLMTASCIDEVVFAIPSNNQNEPLAVFLCNKHIPVYVEIGDENDVLMRFYNCAKLYQPKYIFRATCDNPFVDWNNADILYSHRDEYDYSHITNAPIGTGVEFCTWEALKKTYLETKDPVEHEHVTPYMYRNPQIFRVGEIPYYLQVHRYRLTVDTNEDIKLAQKIYDELYKDTPIHNEAIYAYLNNHPEVASINANIQQKTL